MKDLIRLEKSYEISKRIMKKRATSFYGGFQELPEERFKGVSALYAFCRYVDDVVDNGQRNREEALKALENMEQRLIELEKDPMKFSVSSEKESWWEAFSHTVIKFSIPFAPFFEQIQGQKMDLDFRDIQTLEELIEYSRLVAGSVGKMLAPILVKDEEWITEELYKACESLGIGMQLTNILRDVGEDLNSRNRVYLPLEFLRDRGVLRSELENYSQETKPHISENYKKAWEELFDLADEYYERIEEKILFFHPSTRHGVLTAAYTYREIGVEVRKNNYDSFSKRCYTSKWTRLQLARKAKGEIEKWTREKEKKD